MGRAEQSQFGVAEDAVWHAAGGWKWAQKGLVQGEVPYRWGHDGQSESDEEPTQEEMNTFRRRKAAAERVQVPGWGHSFGTQMNAH